MNIHSGLVSRQFMFICLCPLRTGLQRPHGSVIVRLPAHLQRRLRHIPAAHRSLSQERVQTGGPGGRALCPANQELESAQPTRGRIPPKL